MLISEFIRSKVVRRNEQRFMTCKVTAASLKKLTLLWGCKKKLKNI